MAPALETRKSKSKRGRRLCRKCLRRIDPLEDAVRVATVVDWDRQIGALRYWLCWRCAGELETAFDALSRKAGGIN